MEAEMENVIIGNVLSGGGFVFGGYVRDLFSGDTYRDIDVCFPDEGSVLMFIGNMSRFFSVKMEIAEEGEKYYGTRVFKMQLTDKNGREYKVDCVVGPVPWKNLDFWVNALVLDKTGIHKADIPHGPSFNEIIGMCKAKKLDRHPFCVKKDRLKKMEERGYLLET